MYQSVTLCETKCVESVNLKTLYYKLCQEHVHEQIFHKQWN